MKTYSFFAKIFKKFPKLSIKRSTFSLNYKIDLRGGEDWLLINVWDGDELIGHFLCHVGPYYCQNCYPEISCHCSEKKIKIGIHRNGPQVKSKYKRQGIGSKMYRIAELHFHNRIIPDGKASPEGKRFREKYEKIYGTWANDFESHNSDKLLPEPVAIENGSGEFLKTE